jgi:hypothetical protein
MKPLASLRPGKLRLSLAGIVSCVLVIVGLLLGAMVDMGWLILFGLGAFGSSVLRALGLLRDQDEFQREAARRAGYHAYLAGGFFLCAVAVAKSWGAANLDHDEFSASVGLAVLVIVYFMSRVVSFWGARGAAFRVLLAFGFFWLAFVVLSHPGLELLIESAVALPFFLLAFASRRWPRASGAVLLVVAAFAFWFFGLAKAFRGNQGSVMVILAFVLPLCAMGVALLAARPDEVETAS